MRLLPEAARLTTDAFGNYVIQKLLENGSSEIKRVFAEQLVHGAAGATGSQLAE